VKAVVAVALAAATLVGIAGLADLTQNRPDHMRPGSATVVSFDVATRRYRGPDDTDAAALWSVCAATIPGEDSSMVTTADGGYQVTVTPAIGENGRKRLTGCLEDGTLDRVTGRVIGMEAPERVNGTSDPPAQRS
jgi:hypothetical protein